MPTQRFFHLKEEKKNIIKQAAMEECARVHYADISINQIIKAADISRGSFYTYFEDKDDLIRYLLQDFCDACKKYILDQIEKADGDVVEAAENMTLEMIHHGKDQPNSQIYRNLLLNVGTVTNMKTFGFGGFLHQNEENLKFVEECYKRHNPEKCKVRDEQQMGCVMELLISLALKYTAMHHMAAVKPEEVEEMLHEQLRIIRRGLCE